MGMRISSETFARRWISNAAKGWWFQQGGSWKQK